MTIYDELNDVRLDLSEFEAGALSVRERNNIHKRFKKRVFPAKTNQRWLRVGLVAMSVAVLSLSITFNKGTIANIPLIGGVIEKYIHANKDLNYTPYKSAIGETAENVWGKLTLNEVIVDDRQILIGATFEPAQHVSFNYRTQLTPKVSVNGSDHIVLVGSQSVELNHAMYAIYSDVTLPQDIMTEHVQLDISYDTFKGKPVEQPWVFNIEVSQAQMLEERTIYELNHVVMLTNGDAVTIESVVSTPISTTIYYDLSQSEHEDISIRIQSEDGQPDTYSRSSINNNEPGETSFTRYNGFKMEDQVPYFINIYDADNILLNESPIVINN